MTPEVPRLELERIEALQRREVDLGTLLAYLRAEDYTLDGIRRFLGLDEPPDALLSKPGLYSYLLGDELIDGGSRLGALIQLFFLGGRLSTRAFAALPPSIGRLLEEHGLVRHGDDGMVAGCVSIVELESSLMFADKLFDNLSGGRVVMAHAPVMPMHASSCELYFHSDRKAPGRSFLDVGCGSGCQAVLAAARYERVVAFDNDARAVAFARVNATANRRRIEVSVADALQFADGTRYDHVWFNADSIPDFRSPESEQVSYDFALRFLGSHLPQLLSPAGICQVWCIFFVGERFSSLTQLLDECLPDAQRFRIATKVLERSPFAVSAEDLRQGTIPRRCYLANDEADRKLLLDFVRRTRTREIVVAVLSLGLR
jgi:SAM-dependent methyltransferase